MTTSEIEAAYLGIVARGTHPLLEQLKDSLRELRAADDAARNSASDPNMVVRLSARVSAFDDAIKALDDRLAVERSRCGKEIEAEHAEREPDGGAPVAGQGEDSPSISYLAGSGRKPLAPLFGMRRKGY